MSDDAFLRGARLFDRGEFFQAHEAWEEHWLVETDEGTKRFLQGLIQVAAAFHKLVVVQDAESALRLIAKGLAKLDESAQANVGVSIPAFREGLRRYEVLLAGGRIDVFAIPKLGVEREA
ncbi:MAG: DUF309 domain-containing protein [Polyangiaceae bacterium]